MRIEYIHASKFGNGAMVAAQFQRLMALRGVGVTVRHLREARPADLPAADLYVFSSPGRAGKPIGRMRRFLKKVRLPVGSRYAILTTEMAPKPNDSSSTGEGSTGEGPTGDGGTNPRQQVIPIMNEILRHRGMVEVAEATVLVTGVKGPLEEGWHEKVAAFVAALAAGPEPPERPSVAAGAAMPLRT